MYNCYKIINFIQLSYFWKNKRYNSWNFSFYFFEEDEWCYSITVSFYVNIPKKICCRDCMTKECICILFAETGCIPEKQLDWAMDIISKILFRSIFFWPIWSLFFQDYPPELYVLCGNDYNFFNKFFFFLWSVIPFSSFLFVFYFLVMVLPIFMISHLLE